MRVGLFGGAFDPPHIGHLICAQYAMEKLQLEKVLFIPSGEHPFKGSVETPAAKRLQMVQLAIAGYPGFAVSDREIHRVGPSYTIDTVESLTAEHPDWELTLLLGADNVAALEKWHRIDELLDKVPVAVIERKREHTAKMPYAARLIILDTPIIEISSTEIRDRVKEAKSISFLVTADVKDFIQEQNLYRS